MENAIEVDSLRKTFQVRLRAPGLRGALAGLFRAEVREVVAVDDLSFVIGRGERVAFVGPNGAGKSTTLKVLSGILHPSDGSVRVLGHVPWQERRALAYRIGTVFGSRTQLWYHLPPADSFALLARIYDRDDAAHRRELDRYTEAFALGPLLDKPVRQLSLGERMRCELVASLLHEPEVLFLDEPTIGLDVVAKAVIRDLILEESRRSGRTLLVTSHDTGDMEQVCDRVIVIHAGRLLLDESVGSLRRLIARKRITLHSESERVEVHLAGVHVREREPHRTVLDVDLGRAAVDAVVGHVLRNTTLRDLSVEDPPMEEIVQTIYARAEAGSTGGSWAEATP